MPESDTYMAIIDEGRELQAKRVLLRQGQIRFGPPDEPTKTRVDGITDIDRLERLLDGVLSASSWDDLLEVP